MDQAFDFRAAPVPVWRRLRPRAIVVAVAVAAVVSGVVSFTRWVVESERRSIERAEAAETVGPAVGTISGGEDDLGSAAGVSDRLAVDAAARVDARTALGAARRAASGQSTFLDAGPGQLTPLAASLIFVDGPSQVPGVVSVASTRQAWGAAVMGPSGTCYLLRFARSDGVTYGTGGPCTGDQALGARGPSW
jgi:hypothetical protein